MAYFGKEFKYDREENFDKFFDALGGKDEKAKQYSQYRPNVKLTKDGDTYTLTSTTPQSTRAITFKNGVTFDEVVRDDLKAKTTVTVDGDTYTQVQDYGAKGIVTYKREFTADSLKLTVTTNYWDGVGYRYYVPA